MQQGVKQKSQTNGLVTCIRASTPVSTETCSTLTFSTPIPSSKPVLPASTSNPPPLTSHPHSHRSVCRNRVEVKAAPSTAMALFSDPLPHRDHPHGRCTLHAHGRLPRARRASRFTISPVDGGCHRGFERARRASLHILTHVVRVFSVPSHLSRRLHPCRGLCALPCRLALPKVCI
ncbi:hypothetical protein EJ06DRAFT_394288 [Trichodelitschia bisporula]|uniref:Uncharacterized protein n=1 Tax=Trichodelitschia bisporula TaxID=703511 RepID=A0A6G1HZM6_9PEZI|nr:hypothetical protein EJ06DRAFT_394288 [Trichodelitschia bisporula]